MRGVSAFASAAAADVGTRVNALGRLCYGRCGGGGGGGCTSWPGVGGAELPQRQRAQPEPWWPPWRPARNRLRRAAVHCKLGDGGGGGGGKERKVSRRRAEHNSSRAGRDSDALSDQEQQWWALDDDSALGGDTVGDAAVCDTAGVAAEDEFELFAADAVSEEALASQSEPDDGYAYYQSELMEHSQRDRRFVEGRLVHDIHAAREHMLELARSVRALEADMREIMHSIRHWRAKGDERRVAELMGKGELHWEKRHEALSDIAEEEARRDALEAELERLRGGGEVRVDWADGLEQAEADA